MIPSRIDPRLAAEQRQRFAGEVPVSLLQRLAQAVPELGRVEADLICYRDEQGRYRMAGGVSAELQLECQRCMQPYATRLESQIEAAIVWSDEQARQLPAELEPWLAEDNLDLGGAIEDELLLSLPKMPVHPPEACSGAASYTSGPTEVKSKPFAGLKALKESPGTKS